ncbi:MAG: PKD domain-containing protein, partial [Acidobacteria bacterium]|nr:PKD domain-containing protein [Acidobacteriota bacterium]
MNSIRVYGYWCVLLTVLTLALPAQATTIIMPTDEQLIEKSPVIVRGTVLRSHPVELNGGIWTETVLSVEEVLKGDVSGEVIIREVGGQLGNRQAVVFGSPAYVAGEEVLAFLWPSPRGHYQTMDLFLGKFSEEWTIDGQRLWYRASETSSTLLLDQNFEPIEHENVQRDAARFGQFVRDEVAGRRGDRNYGVSNPRLIDSFQSNFELISEPTIYRWFSFQDGKTVPWKGYGSQSGYSNGGVDDTKTAMASWTGYGEALIRYTWDGMSSSSPGGLDKSNGINEVMFGDPLEEVSGTWTGQGGVVGRGGFNRISGSRTWTSTFSADGAHTSRTYTAYDVIEGNLVIQDGVSPSTGISASRFAEIVAHELGHTLGFGHSDDSSALMYSSVTGLGPSLRSDDQLAARWLYPSGNSSTVAIPAAPSNLSVKALSATTVRLTWTDNSDVETSQTMYVDAGGGYVKLAAPGADVSSLDVGSLKSGQTYSFRVTASNSAGESSASNTATITMPQESVTAAFSFSPTSGTAGETTFVFSDQSNGPVASWQWSFGDGTGSTTRNPSKMYQKSGTYQVTLTVRNSAGQQSSASKSLLITAPIEPVKAAFTVSPTTGTEGGTTFVFSDQSNGPVTSWQWSFGDGTGSTVRNPSKVYQSAGTYSVTLTVKGSSGQQSTSSGQVLVGSAAAPPVSASFDLSASSVTENQQIAFYDRSSGSPTWWQ